MSSDPGWWGRNLRTWVGWVVALCCLLTVILVGAGTFGLARAGAPLNEHTQYVMFEEKWWHVLPAFGMGLVLAVAAMPASTTSVSLRLAVLLPFMHALALVLAVVALPYIDLPTLGDHVPYLEQLPVLPWFASGLGLSLVLAWAIGGRREWTHAFVMHSLAFLLLFALWLPIASLIPVRALDWGWFDGPTYKATLEFLEANPARVAAIAIAPPFVIAAVYTAIAIRAPRIGRSLTIPIIVGLCLVCMASLEARGTGRQGAFLVHDNFMHLLLAAAMLAIVATATLSLSTWLGGWLGLRRLARERGQREFTISDDGADAIATMEIVGWLRGPRIRSRSFIASDGNEELRVPAGVKLVTAVPKESAAMRSGEQIVVVTKRDRLKLGGLVAHDVGDSPFRSHKVTELGPDLVVGRAAPMSTPVESMLLTGWRPSIAYLIILVVAAMPSLVGFLAHPTR